MDNPVSLFIVLQAFINPPTTTVVIANLIILFFITCSGVMSASEVAFFSLSNPEIDSLKESDDAVDNRIAKLLERPRILLSTILIANNLVNIGVVIISYYVTEQMFNFQDFYAGSVLIQGSVIEFMWNVIVVTFFLVLFGEATPKVFATYNKMKIARAMVGVFQLLNKLFFPVNFILVGSTQILERKLKKHNAEIDIEEINKAIEITVEKKESKQDAKLLKGIVHFGNITVKQVMRPRTDVIAIDTELNFNELMDFIREHGYSRYPVYQENLDNIVGILNIKDLLEHLNKDKNFAWQSLASKAIFVPASKKIDDLLRDFQQSRKHIAIVADEFGGTEGIVTLEDIVEEVVGDIKDEFDENTDGDFKKIDDKTFLIDGKAPISDACSMMEISSSTFDSVRGESETMGGLVLELAGRIPKNGEELRACGFKFTIVSVQHFRIEKIKVTNEL
jgi:putative hemolysin